MEFVWYDEVDPAPIDWENLRGLPMDLVVIQTDPHPDHWTERSKP